MQVTARAGPAQVGHAPAAQPDLAARLRPRLDLDLLLAVCSRDRQSGAERCLRDRDGQLEIKLGLSSAQLRMGLHMGNDVQVARHPAPRSGLALAREADLVPVVDAGRDDDAQLALALDSA